MNSTSNPAATECIQRRFVLRHVDHSAQLLSGDEEGLLGLAGAD